MGDQTPEPAATWLLSYYTSRRDADGRLLITSASTLGPTLGCAVPAVVVAIVAWIIGAAGASVLLLLFAVIVVVALLYKGARAWVCSSGSIQPRIGRWYARPARTARSVVLKRELWPGNRGSTDTVFVGTDGDKRLKILSVHNWVGRESRVANGGFGSLARSGPVVSTAPETLRRATDGSLLFMVSAAVRELTEILQRELSTPIVFECEAAAIRPRGR